MSTTSDILEEYKKQLELDKQRENYDLPEGVSESHFTEEMKEAYRKEVDKLRGNTDELEHVYQRFHDTYRKLDDEEINKTAKDEDVKVVIKHAFCPECGKEIVSKLPVMFNPYTGEKIARYDCECGAKFNMEHSYPRIMYINAEGKEISAFND